jgi:hypothetical protein
VKELLEFAGYATAVVIAFVGLGKVFLKYYYRNEAELQKSKHEDRLKETKIIERAIENLEKVTGAHALKMQQLQSSLEKSYLRYEAQVDSIKTLRDEFKDITRELRADIKQVSSVLIQVTTDVSILKSRKH